MSRTWLTSVVIILALLVAGWIGWRRNRAAADMPASRLLRVVYGAGAFALTMSITLVVSEAATRGLSGETPPLLALALAAFFLIGLILLAIADFWLGLFRPTRTWRWLAVAIAAFGLFLAMCVLIAFWVAGESADLRPWDVLQMIGTGAVAGVVWWSFLPAADRDVAPVFE